jgi:hypothetical protein
MMYASRIRELALAVALMTFTATTPVGAEPLGALALAADGQTRYVIVIGKDASEAEKYAAKELGYFLKEMTGAAFPTVTDDTPVTEHEIVLGRTTRGSLDDVPAELKPAVPEGFVIQRQGDKLLIMGNIPRATLYGVYDFLELELGCRFLARDVTHTPRNDTLSIPFESRKYDPPLEYRSLMIVNSSVWAVRARLNGFNYGAIPLEKMLGGGRVVGHPWHSFDVLVPVAEHFEPHPEYFSMKDGKRISLHTQLCLTNPDVFELCMDKFREWLRSDARRADFNPHTLRWVSVTQNDWRNWCECPKCKAIDDEEGGPTGSYVRFVNKIAEALEKEFPGVAVLMFGYMYTTEPPLKTRPRHNVIVQIANSAAGIGLSHPRAKKFVDKLSRWSPVADRIYTWDYITMFGAPYADPYPTLWNHDESVRIFVKNGLKGYFAQGSQSVHAELRDLRMYMAAQCAWRPETDGRKLIEEYCQLYFGPAGPAIVEYIDLTHRPLFEGEGLSPGKEGGLVALEKLLEDDRFLARADAILERAEQLADTPERKLRVANQRLGIWNRIVSKEASRIGKVMDLPLVWRFKLDPDNVGLDQKWWKLADYADWAAIRTDNFWTKQGYDYHGVAWYAVDFDYPQGSPGEPLQFYFGAIDGRCDIYLDGERIAEQKEPPHMMWDKPFFRPIDGRLAPGSHRLVIRVEKKTFAAGVWKPISIVDMAEQVPERVRVAGERFIDVTTKLKMTHFSEFYGKPGDQFKKEIYPRIRTIINRKQFVPSSAPAAPGTLRRHYGTLPDTEWYRSVDDDGAETGRCLQLIPGAPRGVQSSIKPFMAEAQKAGKRYTLRARIKVKKKGDQGDALRWGFRGYSRSWQTLSDESSTIKAADVADGVWTVHEFPLPLPVERMMEYHYVLLYFDPAGDADNIDWVRLDWHELSPK